RICDEEGADLFVSSYYTAPISTPSVFIAHDFIPEMLMSDLDDQIWREKRLAIAHAGTFICVSESTKRDFERLFPAIASERVSVVHNGVDVRFTPAPQMDVAALRKKLNLSRPYFLVVGERIGLNGYKNVAAFFRSMETWAR